MPGPVTSVMGPSAGR